MAKTTTTTTTTQPSSASVLDLITGLANTPTTQTQIGVPKGYKPTTAPQWSDNNDTSVGTPRPQTPYMQSKPGLNGAPTQVQGYQEGDEYAPATWASSDIASIQKQMASVGLLKKGEVFQLGKWDNTTSSAYKTLLGYANQQGISNVQALQSLASGGGNTTVDANGNLVSGTGKANTGYLTNKQDIAAIVQAVAPQVIGKEAPQSVIDTITNTLHAAQTAEANGSGGAEAAPGGDHSWFAQELKTLMPNTYKANNIFNGLTEAQKLIGGKTSPLGDLVTSGA